MRLSRSAPCLLQLSGVKARPTPTAPATPRGGATRVSAFATPDAAAAAAFPDAAAAIVAAAPSGVLSASCFEQAALQRAPSLTFPAAASNVLPFDRKGSSGAAARLALCLATPAAEEEDPGAAPREAAARLSAEIEADVRARVEAELALVREAAVDAPTRDRARVDSGDARAPALRGRGGGGRRRRVAVTDDDGFFVPPVAASAAIVVTAAVAAAPPPPPPPAELVPTLEALALALADVDASRKHTLSMDDDAFEAALAAAVAVAAAPAASALVDPAAA